MRGTHWQWEAEAQFLASRGYVVIEPEFRGSRGFGFPHFRAGWKQWGRAMQDDVADATMWAVAQGWVDAARICIAGGSYGGYAVLMGLVRHHDFYRCGIDWAGVTDIGLMYTIGWSDISEEARGYEMPQLIGDPWLDAAQLEETSPLAQAGKVRRPLLLGYGRLDRRVPIEHGKAFRDAVMRTNRDVEWIEYPDEGHGFRTMKARVDFRSRVERFLDRNVGAAQPGRKRRKLSRNEARELDSLSCPMRTRRGCRAARPVRRIRRGATCAKSRRCRRAAETGA